MKQDGLRFKIYAEKYESKRPKMFILVLQMLIGSEVRLWDWWMLDLNIFRNGKKYTLIILLLSSFSLSSWLEGTSILCVQKIDSELGSDISSVL